ncbi:hypothetical protein ABZZ01_17255 [Streptomyces virginiae]|uniref:hypothetical protein n=1 Tax=Streptomyces virginiae TaxID=1961 RepID=UPI0033AA98A8
MAIGIATMCGAVLTFLSLQEESSAVDDDRYAQLETVTVKSRLVEADIQVRHERALVGRYRQSNAEAGRLEAEAQGAPDAAPLLDSATLMRRVARASSEVGAAFDWSKLRGVGEQATYDYEGRFQDVLQSLEYGSNVPGDQPALTAAAADRHRARSERYALGVVATISVLTLLTVARIGPVRLRPWIAGAGTVAGVVVIPVLVFTEWWA